MDEELEREVRDLVKLAFVSANGSNLADGAQDIAGALQNIASALDNMAEKLNQIEMTLRYK